METTLTKKTQGPAVSLRRPPRPPKPPGLWTGLKPERVQEYLKAMTGWRLMPGDASIGRVREFADPGAASAYAAFVAELACGEGHPFVLEQTGCRISVTLHGLTHRGRPGVTRALLNTARALG
jgi:pterin-4a-carbinolamine dehydratase